ncbi:MAG: TonB family protein [Sulfurovum sp.]|uniref:energy transducer TonB n=1 Tax=Sulfurovum sp. TaxID=1969726 RepID=UPI0028683A89|nr:energy transducer TonB [Sulfurovum sp.]MCO4844748.1 TonB family protein [Sulfurovum sp.]
MYNCKDYTLTPLRALYKESIIRTLNGLLLSLLLHLLILLLFIKNWQEITLLPPKGQEKKISLNLQQMVTPPAPKPKPVVPPQKPVPVPQPVVTPTIPKPIVEKPIEPQVQSIKKKVLDESKKVFAQQSTEENNVTKIEPKPVKKVVKKEKKKKAVKKVQKKTVVKKTKQYRQPKKRSSDPLANLLMGAGTSVNPAQRRRPSSSGSYGARMINQLYGEEFNTYSETQKKFIKNNLGTIHSITQRTLTRNGYPDVAVRTRQQGTNVVSFNLHPNGDISDLKLQRHIGHQALDQNTLDVIRIAYKNYPLPNKKTKIKFYVKYSIY